MIRLASPVVPVLFLAMACLAGCPRVTVGPAGRPCDSDEECGPEAHCAPTTKTCVTGSLDLSVDRDAGADVAGPDAPQPDLSQPDATPTDTQLDQMSSDLGCPSGTTACGSACVDLAKSLDHCGQCFNACPSGAADTCENSTCVCGTTGGLCTGGLTCTGGQCACVMGGLCQGCCQGNTCIPPASQSVPTCGQGGEPCVSCDDNNDCTADGCGQGVCQSLPKPNGSGCDDGDDCTYLDQCLSSSCQGTSTTCSDGLSCTTDTCTGNPPPDDCSFPLDPGNCLVGGTCLADNSSLDSCSQCKTAISIASWTPAAGCVTTLAGERYEGFKNGPQLSAWFDDPEGVAVDSAGKVYVGDRDNHVIRVIADGTVSTFAGVPGQAGFSDGPASTAQFNLPYAVALDSAGKLYVADSDNNRIRVIDTSTGTVSTLAGISATGNTDGPALTVAQFNDPIGVAVDAAGKVYVADRDNHKIRVVSGGTVSTLAGTGSAGYVDGPAAQAQFDTPHGVALDAAGAVYVTDRGNNRIRKIAGGTVSTIAGSGSLPGFQDGPVATALLAGPIGIVVDPSGKVYFSDNDNERIRMVFGGVVSTVASAGVIGHQDGPALTAEFDDPFFIALHAGLIYIADSDNGMIRLLYPQ